MAIGCLPQKAELVYLIPTIRKELAKAMSKNLSGKEIGLKLGLTKSAISQYLNKKRACEITLPTEIKKEIKISASNIENGSSTGMSEISRILEFSKETKFTCKICGEYCK
ncbi:hypothetical protein ACFLZZ_00170 [Nanoarchaeota archaeon]